MGRDTPVALHGIQHPLAGRHIREVPGRLKSGEFEVDHRIQIGSVESILRNNQAEREIVADHRLDPSAIAERVLPAGAVGVNARVGTQPLRVGRDGNAEFDITPAERLISQLSPTEGDLIFYDDHNLVWTALFLWAGTGPPLHVGIVVKKEDGMLAVLEAGPDDTIWVYILDVDLRLQKFHEDYHGTITIRRCKQALSPEKSAALTKFAAAQDGKRYAIVRLLVQGTRFRSRGPIRELFLGSTELDRSSWICSELVVAAGTVAGLFPSTVKANVTYPLDLVNNRRHHLSRIWHDAETWQPSRETGGS